jgi:hypothetical protein
MEPATEDNLKSRMRENCTYGSVRGSGQSLHEANMLEGVSRLSTRLINMLTLEFKMEEAVEVWKEEGREEGIEKVAKNLLLDGVPLGVIVKNTGLPPERIQSLVNP